MFQANKRKIEKAPLMLHKPLKWNWSLRIGVGLFLQKKKNSANTTNPPSRNLRLHVAQVFSLPQR